MHKMCDAVRELTHGGSFQLADLANVALAFESLMLVLRPNLAVTLGRFTVGCLSQYVVDRDTKHRDSVHASNLGRWSRNRVFIWAHRLTDATFGGCFVKT